MRRSNLKALNWKDPLLVAAAILTALSAWLWIQNRVLKDRMAELKGRCGAVVKSVEERKGR